MKNISIAVAAISTIVVAQPSFAAHHNSVHTLHSGHGNLQLGDVFAQCCGGNGNTGSAEILNVPGKGFGAQLQVTQPSCCNSTFVETGIVGVYGTTLFKYIKFTVTGLGTDAPPTANFGVDVFLAGPHGSEQSGFFTVANGGLIKDGNNFILRTGGRNGIPQGSTLLEVDFELDGNCVTTKQTAFVQNVFIDTLPVSYQLDSGSAFCGRLRGLTNYKSKRGFFCRAFSGSSNIPMSANSGTFVVIAEFSISKENRAEFLSACGEDATSFSARRARMSHIRSFNSRRFRRLDCVV